MCKKLPPSWHDLHELWIFHILLKKDRERNKDSQDDQHGAATANSRVKLPLVLIGKLYWDSKEVCSFDRIL